VLKFWFGLRNSQACNFSCRAVYAVSPRLFLNSNDPEPLGTLFLFGPKVLLGLVSCSESQWLGLPTSLTHNVAPTVTRTQSLRKNSLFPLSEKRFCSPSRHGVGPGEYDVDQGEPTMANKTEIPWLCRSVYVWGVDPTLRLRPNTKNSYFDEHNVVLADYISWQAAC